MELETGTEPSPQTQSGGSLSFTIALVFVVVAAIVLVMVIQPQNSRPFSSHQAPKIEVAGWLNGPGPTAEELKGKVIVLDAWAYWCGPCRHSAPELVSLYNRYRDKGVVFIGLTIEGADADQLNRQFLRDTKITWPNGYGAGKTLMELKAEFIPQSWVIDRNYNLVWDESSKESIESAIDRALAEKQ